MQKVKYADLKPGYTYILKIFERRNHNPQGHMICDFSNYVTIKEIERSHHHVERILFYNGSELTRSQFVRNDYICLFFKLPDLENIIYNPEDV